MMLWQRRSTRRRLDPDNFRRAWAAVGTIVAALVLVAALGGLLALDVWLAEVSPIGAAAAIAVELLVPVWVVAYFWDDISV